MKTTKQFLCIGLGITLVLSSCTIEKRVYMSGYHVEWLKDKHNPVENGSENKDNSKKSDTTNIVSDNGQIAQTTIDNNAANETTTASTDNSIFVPSTHKIAFQENNSKTIVNENDAAPEAKKLVKSENKKNKKVNRKAATGGGGKSQLIALLLCIFIGVIGIHRFYLGYTGAGIIQLLTLGCCGIWALIDLIRIITGDLKPKNGNYTDTL